MAEQWCALGSFLNLLGKQRRTFGTRQAVKHACYLLEARDACTRAPVCFDFNSELWWHFGFAHFISEPLHQKKVFIYFCTNLCIFYCIHDLGALQNARDMLENLQQNVLLQSGCPATQLHVKITKGALSKTAARWKQTCSLSVETTHKRSPIAALMATMRML